jgi:transcriptional regulator with XRE-family HTH domain
MPESFGARLRQQREDRQIDLIAISEQTKIKLSLLEALEHDDVSHWPSGIFRRAYIRAYAQFIGLDADAILREFLDVHPDPGDACVATAASAAAAEEEYAKTAPSMRLRNMMDTALGSLRLRRPVSPEKRPLAAAIDVPDEHEARISHDEDGSNWAPFEGEAVDPSSGVVTDPLPEIDVAPPQPAEIAIAVEVAAPPPPAPASAPELTSAAVAEPVQDATMLAAPAASASAPGVQGPDDATLETVAHLCTEFGRVVERNAVRQLLQETAFALSATGLILWLWDDIADGLRPGLVYGYSDRVLAHLPLVALDAENATAAAFRTQTACAVAATAHTSAALVVPLLIPDGCAGVLAIELRQGVQPTRSLRAIASLLAAALTQLVHRSRPTERPAHVERMAPAIAQFRPAARPMKVRR